MSIILPQSPRQNFSRLVDVSVIWSNSLLSVLRIAGFSGRRGQILPILLVVALYCLTAFSQDPERGWQWQNPRPQGNSINAIRFASDKRHGWAVGSDGVVLNTNDGGF